MTDRSPIDNPLLKVWFEHGYEPSDSTNVIKFPYVLKPASSPNTAHTAIKAALQDSDIHRPAYPMPQAT